MKKTIIPILFIFCLSSCNQKKIQELNNYISELELLNEKLSDSLKLNAKDNIMNMTAVGFPAWFKSKVNEPNKINYAFCFSIDMDFPEYNVYRIIDGKSNEKELILSKQNKAGFSYEFIPKSKDDNILELLLEFNIDGKTIEMPSKFHTLVE